jgi:hypothetical protein
MARINWNRVTVFEGVEVRASWVDSLNEARATSFWVERETVIESMRCWMAEAWARAERGIVDHYNTFNGVRWLFEAVTNVTPER